ncbi:hypothetical protein P10159_1876 [Citrobacter portucalensis]|jgi:hypothetical protein|nr:hypothetical protein P10159_1876 [Citrobacter portucalensis]
MPILEFKFDYQTVKSYACEGEAAAGLTYYSPGKFMGL